MKKDISLKERNYKIEISKLSDDDGGGYLAIVPSLPGCMADGETDVDAITNVKDAIKCWIETAIDLGREIPVEDNYRSENDYSGKLSLRIPKSLHKQVSDIADKEVCSINQLIMMYVSMGVGSEFGKRQVNITFNNTSNEMPKIEELQREMWNNYKGSTKQMIDELSIYDNCYKLNR